MPGTAPPWRLSPHPGDTAWSRSQDTRHSHLLLPFFAPPSGLPSQGFHPVGWILGHSRRHSDLLPHFDPIPSKPTPPGTTQTSRYITPSFPLCLGITARHLEFAVEASTRFEFVNTFHLSADYSLPLCPCLPRASYPALRLPSPCPHLEQPLYSHLCTCP